jgi:hypothetical protein
MNSKFLRAICALLLKRRTVSASSHPDTLSFLLLKGKKRYSFGYGVLLLRLG